MDLLFSRTRKIPSKSWGQECCLCSSRHGVPIECSAKGCKKAYHTTCAIRGKLKMQAIFGKNFKGGIKLRSYCKEHSPNMDLNDDKIDSSGVRELDMTNQADDGLQEGGDDLDYFWKYVDVNQVHKNISELYSREKRFNHLDAELSNSVKNKKIDLKEVSSKLDTKVVKYQSKRSKDVVDPLMIDLIYRYWMMLRTANNGQSLIKFSLSAMKEREYEQKKNIMRLRIELERVRNLSYMIGKREKIKLAWLKTHQNIIKRTFSVINDLNPAVDNSPTYDKLETNTSQIITPSTSSGLSLNLPVGPVHVSNNKRSQLSNGMFDESDQLINDLIDCDSIYELPTSCINPNYNNLNYQERSTLERRRTLSLVRRINRQLKTVSMEPSLNPYAKSYLALKRTEASGQSSACVSSSNQLPSKVLKSR